MTKDDLIAALVKPLEWEDVSAENICTRYTAPALGGKMMIVALDPKTDSEGLSVGFDVGGLCYRFILAKYADLFGGPEYTAPAKFYTLAAAQAAAEADYRARMAEGLRLELVEQLVDFIADFRDAKIEAINTPRSYRSPEDEPDPAVDAEEVWAWQADAKTTLTALQTVGAKQ